MNNNDLPSLFLINFMGNLVTITTTQSMEGYPMAFQGFLMENDDKFYYLSHTGDPNKIDQAVEKTHVVQISIVEEVDEATKLLDSIPDPKSDEEIN